MRRAVAAVGAADAAASRPTPPGVVAGLGPQVPGLPIVKRPTAGSPRTTCAPATSRGWPPNGDGPRNHPLLKDLKLPPLGVPNRPAPLLTKTLLFVGEGSNSVIGTPQVDWAWGKKFRAYDKATGAVIAEIELPSGTTGAPMTYMHKGKQYIVVPIGARDHPAEFVALGLTDTKPTSAGSR